MATICYSLAGEGRGHATRVRTIVEHLRGEHRFVIFAPGDAYAMLGPLYAQSDVRVVQIPGLHFAYAPDGTMSPWRTALGAVAYAARLSGLVRRLTRELEAARADLVIADFEPALQRAAARLGIPCVSLDHQHFLVTSDFRELPGALRRRAERLGRIVRLYDARHAATIVSSFCFPRLREGLRNVVQIGPLLRPRVLAAKSEHGAHLVVYLRKFASARLLDALGALGRDVRIYGLGEQPARGRLRFCPIDEQRFVDDLASSHALVTTAGNQLLGEALYLRKPVLALPEPGNAEQLVHGHLLARERTGEWLDFERVDDTAVRRFIARADALRANIVTERLNGNAAALAELARFVPPATPTSRAHFPEAAAS